MFYNSIQRIKRDFLGMQIGKYRRIIRYRRVIQRIIKALFSPDNRIQDTYDTQISSTVCISYMPNLQYGNLYIYPLGERNMLNER